MAKKFEWDYAAAGELLLRSPEIAEFCGQQAERMTRATGMAYVPDIKVGTQRVSAGGYDNIKVSKKKTAEKVCPKCGRAHPNCHCRGG